MKSHSRAAEVVDGGAFRDLVGIYVIERWVPIHAVRVCVAVPGPTEQGTNNPNIPNKTMQRNAAQHSLSACKFWWLWISRRGFSYGIQLHMWREVDRQFPSTAEGTQHPTYLNGCLILSFVPRHATCRWATRLCLVAAGLHNMRTYIHT